MKRGFMMFEFAFLALVGGILFCVFYFDYKAERLEDRSDYVRATKADIDELKALLIEIKKKLEKKPEADFEVKLIPPKTTPKWREELLYKDVPEVILKEIKLASPVKPLTK